MCDHFVVVEKKSDAILFRGGSPSDENDLRQVDTLMQAVVDVQGDTVVFQLKCMFYNGTKAGSAPPLPEVLTPLHLLYARALAANGVANCTV